MKKSLFVLIIFILSLLPLRGELVVTVGGAFSGPFKMDNINFSTTWNQPDGYVSFLEENISLFDGKGGIGFNAGIASFFNYNIGVGVNISYFKTNFDIANSFYWEWLWYDDTGSSREKDWTTTGSVSIIPISLNLIYRIVSRENLRVNLSGGPTVYLCSVKLNGHYGYADFLETSTEYLVDYFDVDMYNSINKTVFGGNISIDMEYFISEGMSFFIGGTYYISGKITDTWFQKAGQLTGVLGQLTRPFDEGPIDGYTYSVKISVFAAKAGIKVYL